MIKQLSRLVVCLGLLAPLRVRAQAAPSGETQHAPEQSAANAAPPALPPAQAAEAKPAAGELAAASAATPSTSSEPREREAKEEPELDSRWSLGVRGFAGGIFSPEDKRGGGGGSLLLAFGIVPERWELELGLSVADGPGRPPLGVFELVVKRVLERRGSWAPHILLGPLFSLDFGDELKPAGGVIAGGGVTYWLVPRIGLVADATYRLLIGDEVEHIVALAAGVTFRL